MTDTRWDVAERLEALATMNRPAKKHASALLEAAALLREQSGGREPDGHCTGSLREGGVDFIAVRVRDGLHVPQPIGTPVYFGIPSDSPAGEACPLPPTGWRCTREPGHQGPCAAVEVDQ